MRPLPFVWPYALLFWAVEIWTFLPEFKVIGAAKRSSDKDGKSLQVILIGLNAAYFGAFFIAWVPQWQIHSYRVPVFFLGVAMMVVGSAFRRHCFRMLGQSFTGDVRADANQQVVTRGAYSILRHPSYTAAIIMNSGLAIALGTWAGLLILLVMSVIVYSYRISVEERALLTT